MSTFTLTGSGIQAISTPGSLAIVVTVGASLGFVGNANPANQYHLGLLRLGTAHGYLPAVPVDAVNMLLPCPAAAVNLGYKLTTGVTITVEERAEVLTQVGVVPSSVIPPAPNIVTPFSDLSLGGILAATAASVAASGAWFSANAAVFYPFRLSAPFTSTNFFWLNGGVVSGNVCGGVYDASFTRLATTGSTAQATTQAIQTVAMAIALTPGLYYLALAIDNVTAQLYNAASSSPRNALTGARRQASAFVLPNPGVPTANGAVSNVYVCGLTTYAP